jgi:hypothetical protein
MKYKLLALDVDGTLLGPDGNLAESTRDALAHAVGSGLRVCLATGRTYKETLDVWRGLELPAPHDPLIVLAGAMVREPVEGRTLCLRRIEPNAAVELAEAFHRRGLSVVATLDEWRCGLDYLVWPGENYEQVRSRWLDRFPVEICPRESWSPADLSACARLIAMVEPDQAPSLARELGARFADRLHLYAIHAPNFGMTVVEAYAPGVNKASALGYVVQGYGWGLGAVAAIGDDVNDLQMIEAAGLGAVMPHARAEIRARGDVVVEATLGRFIDELVAGRYDEV